MTQDEETRYFSCTCKVAFKSRSKARRAAQVTNGYPGCKVKGLQAYVCAFCSQWHIGHKVSPQRRRQIEQVAATLHV